AYSSLAHLGFIVLGTFALTTQGLTGSVIQMVNHGLVIALLFIVIGWIYQRRRTWQASELRGLQKPAPILAAVFMVALLATIGLPGLNGFVGEFLILIGTFLTHRWWAVVATGGVVLAAIYMLWAYQQVFHHEPDPADADTPDLSWREGAVVAPLVILIIFLGVYPKPVLDRITPSVNLLVHNVDVATGSHQPGGVGIPRRVAGASSTRSSGSSARAGSAMGPTSTVVGTVRAGRSPGAAGTTVRAFTGRMP
ncbi:MAG TPA: proton-conducting transporter membrane subunit, partial [Acidimicrobiales bacterium]